jgi:predicted lipid-binding transport protein (Tim44 family)
MGAGGFPIDLVLFGMIAAFLVLRLRSILGRRQGFERPAETRGPARPAVAEGPVIDAVAERPVVSRALPDPATPVGQTLARMEGVDRNFQPARFLDGAEVAFRMIVTAFAAGNREDLRRLLSDDTYNAFASAISTRETAGDTQRTEVRAVDSATIEAAELRDKTADITVRFVTDQVNIVTATDGAVVTGTDAVTEMTDVWTFERDLAAADPSWRLIAARSA